jgi:hypothetical protein
MLMRLKPITTVSSLPKYLLNALLGPLLRARSTGYDTQALNFLTDIEHLNSTAADAPVGYLPGGGTYANIVPTLHALDPTSKLALSTRLFHENDRSTTIGRTSTIREKMYNYAISGMFAEWWKEFCLLAALAADADRSRKNGKTKIHPNREVYEGDGYVEAFLMACGDLTDPIIGLTPSDDVDLDVVFSQLTTRFKSVIHALGQDGFAEVIKDVSNTYGIGMSPVDKGNVALIRAECFEKLFSGNLRMLLRHPHARKMLRHVILSRIPAEVCGRDVPFNIVQGHDTIVIPGDIMQAPTPSQVLDAMCEQIDARPQLSTDLYRLTDFQFTHQFYTTGDLVNALFVQQTVEPLEESQLNVLLGMPVQCSIQGVLGASVSDYIMGTGGLGSVDGIRVDRINPIMGMDPFYTFFNEEIPGSASSAIRTYERSMLFNLPNQNLDMSSCANATALDWIEFLTWYGRAQSADLKTVMNIGGESKTLEKQDLKIAKVALANPLTAYAKLNYDSQRDGVMSRAFASYNQSKPNRIGQQGPVLVDHSHHVGPRILTSSNEWTRVEPSTHLTRPSVDGGTLALDVHLDSGFVGEPQGSKTASPYVPKGIVLEEQLGMNDTEKATAYNIMSMPLSLDGRETLPMTIDEGYLYSNSIGAGSGFNQRADSIGKQAGWNRHPIDGFKRGYIFGRTSTGGFSTPSNVINALGSWTRTATSNAISFQRYRLGVSIGSHTVNFPSGSLTSLTTPETQITHLRDTQLYHEQAYAGSDSDADLMRSVWYWDPSQTNSLGNTNYVLKGEYCNSLCFSAGHAIHPHVAVGAIETKDLNGDSPNTETTTGSIFVLSDADPGTGITGSSARNCPIGNTRDIAVLDGRIEQETSNYPAVMVTNGWFDSADVISEEWVAQHDGDVGFSIVSNQVYDGSSASLIEYENIDHMNVFRKLISKTNPYATGVNLLSGYGLNATDGSYTGAVHWPIEPNPMPNYFDGPSISPINGDKTSITVVGVGQTRYDSRDTYVHSVLSAVCTRLLGYSEETVSSHYPLGNLAEQIECWAMSGAVRLVSSSGAYPSIPNVASNSVQSGRLSNLPDYVPVTEQWFLNVAGRTPAVVPRSLSERRKDKLMGMKNPWTRETNADSGWKVGVYDSAKSQTMIGGEIRDAMVLEGSKPMTGMSNSDWRNIYIRS